jgi:hypothetical protein
VFMVQTGSPGHLLSDAGNPGLGVNSGDLDPNPNELSANEQLFFSPIQLTNVSIHDPLGLLQSGATVSNPRWRSLRSATFAAPSDFASTSSDAAVTADVKMFDDVTNSINNNYTDGTFGPLDYHDGRELAAQGHRLPGGGGVRACPGAGDSADILVRRPGGDLRRSYDACNHGQ